MKSLTPLMVRKKKTFPYRGSIPKQARPDFPSQLPRIIEQYESEGTAGGDVSHVRGSNLPFLPI